MFGMILANFGYISQSRAFISQFQIHISQTRAFISQFQIHISQTQAFISQTLFTLQRFH